MRVEAWWWSAAGRQSPGCDRHFAPAAPATGAPRSAAGGAQQREAAAGRTLHFAGDRERHVELVVQGLIRVHASAPDGRTLTIRYCRPGSLMGILSLYAEPFLMPATTQALVDSELLGINPDLVRQLADRDVRVAKALLLELTERATVLTAEIGGPAFSTVRQRVARHLDLAAQRQQGSELTAQVSGKNLRMPSEPCGR